MTRDWRFDLGRARATCRIGFDYMRSLVAPVGQSSRGEPVPLDTAHLTIGGGADAGALPTPLRLLCWNIHRAYDAAGVRVGLRAAVGRLDPDLLMLQEVPVGVDGPWWSGAGVRELLAEHSLVYAPMHRVRRPSPYYPFRESGLLVAVRGMIEDPSGVLLPIVSRPKLGPGHAIGRVAVGARCTVGHTAVGIWNVHLENTARPSGRARQARAAAAAVGDGPAVLCGDFNTLLGPLETVDQVLGHAGFERVPLAGRRCPTPQLDRFYLRGLRALRAERLALGGSDHLPIYGEFDLDS